MGGNLMTGIEGKVVAITGASGGIGAAPAELLAERGATVVLGARREERLAALAARIAEAGGVAAFQVTDVRRRADLAGLTALATGRYGRLDVLVSNVGLGLVSPFDALRVQDWEEMVDTNIKGVLYGIAAALPVFRRQGRGHLVTTVSTSGLRITPTMAVYAATKNGVRTLMEGLRQESTDGSLRTTAISPGYVRTELADSIDNPEIRDQIRRSSHEFAIAPDAVARAITFAIEQPDDVEIGDITIRPAVQG
jgi:NADP-dependent 3-hydroxy acid dehydrogenase YdfG